MIMIIDDRMITVKKFDLHRKSKNRSSLVKEGINYALHDFNIDLNITSNSFEASFEKISEIRTTDIMEEVKREMKIREEMKLETELMNSTWQGRMYKIRRDDEHLVKKTCYNWLTHWKDCPVNVINDLQSIYLQIVPT